MFTACFSFLFVVSCICVIFAIKMANDNGKIGDDVDLVGDVYAVLGITPTDGACDLADACCDVHGKINPASKRKPVRHDGFAALTDGQFKGTAADNASGIYYGLKVRAASGGYPAVHECDYSYLPPRAGVDWCRLTDFAGYDHGATFNPVGSLPSEAFMDLDSNMEVSVLVRLRTVNGQMVVDKECGVNLDDIMDVSSDNLDLGDYYPLILVSGVSADGKPAGPHMLRALKNAHTLGYDPLRTSDGAWWGNYIAETSHTQTSSGANSGGGLDVSRPCLKICTVFLVRTINPLAMAGMDVTVWNDVSTAIPTVPMFAVPNAAGKIVDFKRFYGKGMKLASWSLFVRDNYLACSVLAEWETDVDPDVTYLFIANLERRGDGDASVPIGGDSFTARYVQPDGSVKPLLSVTFNTRMTVMGGDVPSGEYLLYWYVQDSTDDTRILNSGADTRIV